MTRGDLMIRLVQAGLRGDVTQVKQVTQAILAEARAKRHTSLVTRLESALAKPEGTVSQCEGTLREITTPQKKLADLILPNEVVDACQLLIQEQRQADLLRPFNLEPRSRILLIGPPGNGKTSLAEAIAQSLEIPMLIVCYESLVGSLLGVTGSRLKKLFEYVSSRRCVVFFDEFETLGKERGDQYEVGEIKRVVSSLLLQIDNLPSSSIVIGATNHAELLDRAAWRRFQIRMRLPGPTRAGLIEWFERFERRIPMSLEHSPADLADHFLSSNFAEVEQFGDTVFRQRVLQSNIGMKEIVLRTLKRLPVESVTMEDT